MRAFIFIMLLCIFCAVFPTHATDQNLPLNYAHFQRLPVLHEGRIKPLDSFARLQLKNLSGQERIEDLISSAWLAEAIFDPVSAAAREIFLVRHPDLKALLELEVSKTSYNLLDLQEGLGQTVPQVEALLDKEPGDLTPPQTELLRLHDNVLAFMELLRSFSMILPLDITLPEKYQDLIENDDITYAELTHIETRLRDDLQNLIEHKGKNPDDYTQEETRLAELVFHIELLRLGGKSNAALRIMPGVWNNNQKEWASPWEIFRNGAGSPENAIYLKLWQDMAKSYRNDNAQTWNASSDATLTYIISRTKDQSSRSKFSLEIAYNKFRPLSTAIIFYALSIVCLLAAFFRLPDFLKNAALLSLSAGIIIHGSGVVTRIVLLGRPPVGTLYESVIFVALICAICAFFLARKNKSTPAILSGSAAGGGLLALAPSLLTQGENMEMLVAVLNTNFWLSTHVICITAGYGMCILSACLAHNYLFMRAAGQDRDKIKNLQPVLYKLALAALLLMACGTALGGIWADQSWGRFWGWDPKENGALLIVLWLIWALHGRASGKLRPLGFTIALACLNIIVALAWFGVNLLNVGLHSYGFTSGIAAGLLGFCGLEIFVITALWALIKHKERIAHAA